MKPRFFKSFEIASDNGVTCVLIMIDGEGDQDFGSQDQARRDKAVDNHKKWVDAAAALGCHAIRINCVMMMPLASGLSRSAGAKGGGIRITHCSSPRRIW